MRMNLTTLFTLPVELDSENSIATQPSDAKTSKAIRMIGMPKSYIKSNTAPLSSLAATYPEEESSGLESEATDDDELPKNDRGM